MINGSKAFLRGLGLTVMLLLVTSSKVNMLAGKPASDLPTYHLKEVTVVAKKTKAPARKRVAELCGFKLTGGLNANVSDKIQNALETYKGPKVLVTSLKRNWNRKSDHFHGNAVDFEFSHDMIMYLISEEGRQWLEENGLYFYIEGRPGSKKVKEYLGDANTAPHVFFNPNARGRTGDHIHLGVE